MFWSILVVALVCALAWFIRKATRGTVFAGKCPCTPNIERLKWIEKDKDQREGMRKENLW